MTKERPSSLSPMPLQPCSSWLCDAADCSKTTSPGIHCRDTSPAFWIVTEFQWSKYNKTFEKEVKSSQADKGVVCQWGEHFLEQSDRKYERVLTRCTLNVPPQIKQHIHSLTSRLQWAVTRMPAWLRAKPLSCRMFEEQNLEFRRAQTSQTDCLGFFHFKTQLGR